MMTPVEKRFWRIVYGYALSLAALLIIAEGYYLASLLFPYRPQTMAAEPTPVPVAPPAAAVASRVIRIQTDCHSDGNITLQGAVVATLQGPPADLTAGFGPEPRTVQVECGIQSAAVTLLSTGDALRLAAPPEIAGVTKLAIGSIGSTTVCRPGDEQLCSTEWRPACQLPPPDGVDLQIRLYSAPQRACDYGALHVTAVDESGEPISSPADVWIDGEPVARAPDGVIPIPRGPHDIRVRAKGYFSSANRRVLVTAGREHPLRVLLPSAPLDDARPPGEQPLHAAARPVSFDTTPATPPLEIPAPSLRVAHDHFAWAADCGCLRADPSGGYRFQSRGKHFVPLLRPIGQYTFVVRRPAASDAIVVLANADARNHAAYTIGQRALTRTLRLRGGHKEEIPLQAQALPGPGQPVTVTLERGPKAIRLLINGQQADMWTDPAALSIPGRTGLWIRSNANIILERMNFHGSIVAE